jgi:hypothetical protein
LDVSGLPAERVEAELVGLAARDAALKARFLAVLGEFVERGLWESWGVCVCGAVVGVEVWDGCGDGP